MIPNQISFIVKLTPDAKGYIDYIITTNLNYRPKDILGKPWYVEADMSSYLASIINAFNYNVSLEYAIHSSAKIQALLKSHGEADDYDYVGSLV